MKTIELRSFGVAGLTHVERPVPKPAAGEVLVRILAASLNYRDIEILEGRYGAPVSLPVVPMSDAVAEITELGANTGRFAIGDKVNLMFFPHWLDGAFNADFFGQQRGSSVSGVLQEFVAVRESELVRAPTHLGIEAATLPIAALTAWNALRDANIRPGQTVLVIGTGGVSLFALQIARMLGARTVVVSSSAEKLRKAQALGADELIDRSEYSDWGVRVQELTGGADIILETGGRETLPQSTSALKMGGCMAMIGYLSGADVTLDMRALFIGKRARLHGHTVGSRADFEEMNRALETHRLVPVIDSTFPLERVEDAYERARTRAAFGKVVINVAG